jgi:molybdopterin molybdotransferase
MTTTLLTVEQARDIMRTQASAVRETEIVTLHDALGRVLAEDIVSPIAVPAHDNSAMDGYALRGADLAAGKDTILKIVGGAYAGHGYGGSIAQGECIAIMTGAMMPRDCDTVVPQELVTKPASDSILIPADTIKAGDNRRMAGEDLSKGGIALKRGKILRPADLGLLASLGFAEAPVRRKLRVAFFSTGDELRSPGETLAPGCIYDSNRYTVFGMLARLGCETIDMGVVKDDPAALEQALRDACAQADAVITSGGVSSGEADYTRQIMQKLGEVAFWKLAMRPGRPLAFGSISSEGKTVALFGLPGNPVAAMASFYFCVRDALLKMMGADATPLPALRARSQAAIRKKPGRTEYQRGVLSADADGMPQVRITGSQSSGILRSMSEANCMIVLPHDMDGVNAGDSVDVVVFEGLI